MGTSFTVYTDRTPLKDVFNNRRNKSTAGIERMRLKLQQYNFTVTYQKGGNNPPNYLSRKPFLTSRNRTIGQQIEQYCNFVG